jgi:hypothetical protein
MRGLGLLVVNRACGRRIIAFIIGKGIANKIEAKTQGNKHALLYHSSLQMI